MREKRPRYPQIDPTIFKEMNKGKIHSKKHPEYKILQPIIYIIWVLVKVIINLPEIEPLLLPKENKEILFKICLISKIAPIEFLNSNFMKSKTKNMKIPIRSIMQIINKY